MKIKSEKDFWSGIMFLVVGIVFAVGATNYSMGTSARPGPGYFPLILSVILAILGAIVLFKSLTIETEGGDKIGHIAWTRARAEALASTATKSDGTMLVGMAIMPPTEEILMMRP